MHDSKNRANQKRCQPKPHACCQDKLRIATKGKLFVNPDGKKVESPADSIEDGLRNIDVVFG
jgi:hypothetical protein